MFEEQRRSLLLRLLDTLGKLSKWQDASKACFISLCGVMVHVSFLAWFTLHAIQLEVFGSNYLPYDEQSLTSVISFSALLSLAMVALSVIAACCVVYDKCQSIILSCNLYSLAISLSILVSMIGIFDGITWLIILVHTALGFVFLKRTQVIGFIIVLMSCMFCWSVYFESLPFLVRAYQFTDLVSFSTMTRPELIANWLSTIFTMCFCIAVLYLLMGAWRLKDKDLRFKSFKDELTSLYNRRAIQNGLREEFFRAKRGKYGLSVAMLDLDHFKQVNDKYGHPFGDKVLEMVSVLMLEVTRKKDLVGRYGGEEFLIVFPECSAQQAQDVLNRLREKLAQQDELLDGSKPVSLSLSAGVTEVQLIDTFETVMQRADSALYHAKTQGRDRVVCE